MANNVQNSLIAPPTTVTQPEASGWTEIADKIQKYFTRIEGALTIFSIVAGIAIAILWNVQIGLLAVSIGNLAALAIAYFRPAEEAQPRVQTLRESLNLPPLPPNHPKNPLIPGTNTHLENFMDEMYQQARREEADAERHEREVFRREVRFVRNIPVDAQLVEQTNFPEPLPFEKGELVKFLYRCFPGMGFHGMQYVEVDETFQWGDSGGDYVRPKSLSLCAMVPGVEISFSYQGKQYKLHTTKKGVPDGLFQKKEVIIPEESAWKLIALNRV